MLDIVLHIILTRLSDISGIHQFLKYKYEFVQKYISFYLGVYIQVWITVGKKSHLGKKVMCYAPVNMNEKRINIRNNFR